MLRGPNLEDSSGGVGISYVTEDGANDYVTEDGSNSYVTEA